MDTNDKVLRKSLGMRSNTSRVLGTRRIVKLMGLALGAILVLGGVQSSVADEGYDELARFPGQGIPDPKVAGTWVTPQQAGLTYLKRTKQWSRTPTLQSVAYNRATQRFTDPLCTRIRQAPGAYDFREWWADVVLVDRSAPMNSPRRYGYTQSFEVRAVAFGSVPIEATVALEQPRNGRGAVVPTELKQGEARYCQGKGDLEIPAPAQDQTVFRMMPAEVEGRLRVRVDRVKVDGVALNMTGCGADNSELKLTSRDLLSWDPRISTEDMPNNLLETRLRTPYFAATTGGLLFGSLDIPAFSGCVTAGGDDLSALLTATVSGAGNAVQIRTEGTTRSADDSGVADEFDVCPFARNCSDRFPVPDLPTEAPS